MSPLGEVIIRLVKPLPAPVVAVRTTLPATSSTFGTPVVSEPLLDVADRVLDVQIVVCNDGSTDGTRAVLEKLQAQMPNLKVVHHEKNQGYGASVRTGCDNADKTWVAFMDSDGQFKAQDLRRLLPLTQTVDFVPGIREKRADAFQRRLNSKL